MKEDHTILRFVQPEDLLLYGLIPEFIGRLPVVSALEPLDDEMLLQILTKPKNALVKQYQKLFKLEETDLVITDSAMKVIVRQAIERGTGARGLRSILEEKMIPVMFDLPSRKNVRKCIIDEGVILGTAEPDFQLREQNVA